MNIENPMVTGVGLPEDAQQAEVVFYCDYCNGEIYHGDTFVAYEELVFCSSDHLGEHLVKHNLAEECTADADIYH